MGIFGRYEARVGHASLFPCAAVVAFYFTEGIVGKFVSAECGDGIVDPFMLVLQNAILVGAVLMTLMTVPHTAPERKYITGDATLRLAGSALRGLFAGVIALPLIVWILQLFSDRLFKLFGVNGIPQQLVVMLNSGQIPHFVFSAIIFIVVFIAPVCEEFFFRYALDAMLEVRLRSRTQAIVVTALVFAGMHMNLLAFIPLVAVSIFCSIAYLRERTIIAPIILHASFNLVSVIFAIV